MSALVNTTQKIVRSAVREPRSVGRAGLLLNREYGEVGNHQRGALKHALICGAILHWVKAQLKRGEWGAWLRENFGGSDQRARDYMNLARAYANPQNSGDLDACPTLSEALEMVQTLPVDTDLPAALPGLMEPRETKPRPEEVGEGDDTDSAFPNAGSSDCDRWSDEASQEELNRLNAEQAAEEERRAQSPPQRAMDALAPADPYPFAVAALDALSRAQGALQRGDHGVLAGEARHAHRIMRGVVTNLHRRGLADV